MGRDRPVARAMAALLSPSAGRLAQVEGVEVYQDGDREKTLRSHVDRFPEVAEIVKPRRRRQVSGAERSRLLQIGLRTQFPGEQNRQSEHSQRPGKPGTHAA